MVKARAVDKWKTKTWYSVLAPDLFEGKEIAVVPADDDAKLMNRIVKISLGDLTGDMTQAYTNLQFRISEVKGKSASTKLVGHELSPSYLRSLVRRRRDIVNDVIDVVTKDNMPVRVKVSLYTARKVSTPARAAVRHAERKEILERAKEMDFSTFMQEIVFGKFSSRIYKAVKRIVPVKRVEVRKTEVKETFAA